jgi:hypothetical protein
MSVFMTAYGFNMELPANGFLDYDPIMDWVENFLFSEARWPTKADVVARAKELSVDVHEFTHEVAMCFCELMDI